MKHDDLVPQDYEEIRRLAAVEKPGQTLDDTLSRLAIEQTRIDEIIQLHSCGGSTKAE